MEINEKELPEAQQKALLIALKQDFEIYKVYGYKQHTIIKMKNKFRNKYIEIYPDGTNESGLNIFLSIEECQVIDDSEKGLIIQPHISKYKPMRNYNLMF
jgi:hypothetical protein